MRSAAFQPSSAASKAAALHPEDRNPSPSHASPATLSPVCLREDPPLPEGGQPDWDAAGSSPSPASPHLLPAPVEDGLPEPPVNAAAVSLVQQATRHPQSAALSLHTAVTCCRPRHTRPAPVSDPARSRTTPARDPRIRATPVDRTPGCESRG